MRQKQAERTVIDQTAEPAVDLDDVVAASTGGVLDKVVNATKQKLAPKYGYVDVQVGTTCSGKPVYEKRRVRLS